MLEFVGVNVAVDGGAKRVLSDVSFVVPKGELVVVTGRNGSGKTTLAKALMGILPVASGKIFWKEREITELGCDQRAAAGIGIALQQPVRFKGIKVREMLGMAADKRLSSAELDKVLGQVGLRAEDYVERNLGAELSGGEMKRIEVAMLLARDCELMIFDEPEAGIDLWSFEKLVEVFRRLKSGRKHTIIVVSHQRQILEIADRILMMRRGRVEAYGKRDEMMERLCLTK